MPPYRLFLSRLVLLAVPTLLLASLPAQAKAPPRPLTVTTLNIKFFGTNGLMDNPRGTETRSRTIRDHFTANNLWTDVIVFQEIVDVALLKSQVVGSDYKCQSYPHPDATHQHVVICAKRQYVWGRAADEDNYALEDVTLNQPRYRPAVHGVLKTASGEELLHIVAVHLKSAPQFSGTRMRQINVIADYLSQRGDEAPVVMLGDFNTFEDDVENMGGVLADVGEGLSEVRTPGDYTWRSGGTKGNKFDHVWISNSLSASKVKIAGPCNSTDRALVAAYNKQVSDHCPVTLTLKATEDVSVTP